MQDKIIPASIAPVTWAILDAYNRGYVNEDNMFVYGFLMDKNDAALDELFKRFGRIETDEDRIFYTVEASLNNQYEDYLKYTKGVRKGKPTNNTYVASVYTPLALEYTYPDKGFVDVLPIWEIVPDKGNRLDYIRALMSGDDTDVKPKYIPDELVKIVGHSFPALSRELGGEKFIRENITKNPTIIKAIIDTFRTVYNVDFNHMASLPFNDLSFMPIVSDD